MLHFTWPSAEIAQLQLDPNSAKLHTESHPKKGANLVVWWPLVALSNNCQNFVLSRIKRSWKIWCKQNKHKTRVAKAYVLLSRVGGPGDKRVCKSIPGHYGMCLVWRPLHVQARGKVFHHRYLVFIYLKRINDCKPVWCSGSYICACVSNWERSLGLIPWWCNLFCCAAYILFIFSTEVSTNVTCHTSC